MNLTLSHLRTSFLTTAFITRFTLLWCSMEVFAFSSISLLCMHIDGLIPFKSSIDQAMASLCCLRISTILCSFYEVKSTTMITGLDLSSLRKTYFKCLGNSFKISPSELLSSSCTFISLLLELQALIPSLRLKMVSVNSAF